MYVKNEDGTLPGAGVDLETRTKRRKWATPGDPFLLHAGFSPSPLFSSINSVSIVALTA